MFSSFCFCKEKKSAPFQTEGRRALKENAYFTNVSYGKKKKKTLLEKDL